MSAEAFQTQLPAVSVTLGVTTTNIALNGGNPVGTHNVMVSNTGTSWAWIVLDRSSVVSAFPTPGSATGVPGFPVGPNSSFVARGADYITHAAAIGVAANGTIVFTPGEGKL